MARDALTDKSLILRPTLRNIDVAVPMITLELVALLFLAAAVGDQTREGLVDLLAPWEMVAVCGVAPILWLLFGQVFVDEERVGKRDAVGRLSPARRQDVAKIERLSYLTLYFLAADGSPLF